MQTTTTHKLKDHTMSLEQAITDHAGALRELAAAIRSTLPSIGSRSAELDAATDKVIADAKKPAAATASSPSGAERQTTALKASAQGGEEKKPDAAKEPTGSKPEAGPASSDAPTYDDVKTKVLALAQAKGRDTVLALLQRHGVAKAPDLKEGQWARVIEDADAIMAGTYDPAASEELA